MSLMLCYLGGTSSEALNIISTLILPVSSDRYSTVYFSISFIQGLPTIAFRTQSSDIQNAIWNCSLIIHCYHNNGINME